MQQFTEWVVEMPADREASALEGYVGDGSDSGRFSVGTASGRLFALLVAGSFMEGIEPFESRGGQIRSRSVLVAMGSARRFGDRGPPRRLTARSMAAISILVTYGSRPVMPKRQHSVVAGHDDPAFIASTSA